MRDDIRKDLESFGFGPNLLQAALRQFPKKMWCYQTSPDRWSIHDIVIHLADSEASTYVRCRRIIAEPGSAILKFDGERWAKSLGYFNQSAREALDIIFYLRKATHKLLGGLPDHVWDNSVISSLPWSAGSPSKNGFRSRSATSLITSIRCAKITTAGTSFIRRENQLPGCSRFPRT